MSQVNLSRFLIGLDISINVILYICDNIISSYNMARVYVIREFTIHDVASSTTRSQNKEIRHARQKGWIICSLNSFIGSVAILGTPSKE